MVKNLLEKTWKLKGDFTMTIHGEQAFVFEFSCVEDRVTALEHGPVYIANRLFVIRPWKLNVEQNIAELRTVPIWVNLRNIPIFLWNPKGISLVASYLGRPLMMDSTTASQSRMAFARVCVEVEAIKELPSVIHGLIDGKIEIAVPVEYSWKPPKCDVCKTFGHGNSKCPKQHGKDGSSGMKKNVKMWVPKGNQGGDTAKDSQDYRDATEHEVVMKDESYVGSVILHGYNSQICVTIENYMEAGTLQGQGAVENQCGQ